MGGKMTVGGWFGGARGCVPGSVVEAFVREATRMLGARPGCAPIGLLAALVLAPLDLHAGSPASSDHPGARAHPWPGGRIEVIVPAEEPEVAGTIEVVLVEGELPIARLSSRRSGPLLESHLTDLDGDGAQELLLVYGNPARIEAWEWQPRRHAFARLELPPIESDQPLREGRFRLDGETLTYTARPASGKADPMTWNYDGDDARWERRRRFWPW